VGEWLYIAITVVDCTWVKDCPEDIGNVCSCFSWERARKSVLKESPLLFTTYPKHIC